MILITFTWKGILLPPAPSAPPKVGPGCKFLLFSPPLCSHPGLDRLPKEEKTIRAFE